ncbi:MAG: rpfC 1 [Hyphomicrobiales bacterium]|nr:rpfC 1 [Hyphomicrobiales bacterium]
MALDPDLPQPPFRVLVLDDSRTSALSLARLLAAEGREVAVRPATEAALAAMSVDLLVVDLDAAPGDELARARLCADARERWPDALTVGLARPGPEGPPPAGAVLDRRLAKPVDGPALRALAQACEQETRARAASPDPQTFGGDWGTEWGEEDAPRVLARLHEAMGEEPSLLDQGALKALLALGEPAFVAEIVAQFLDESRGVLASLGESLAARDAPGFAAALHALRSGAANVGAGAIYRLCLSWRETTNEDLIREGEERLALLVRQFDRTAAALRLHLAGLGAQTQAARPSPGTHRTRAS